MVSKTKEGRSRDQALGGLLLVCLAALLIAGSAALLLAAAQPAQAAADLSVSSPADPIPVVPGAPASFTLEVANVGTTPLKVTITAERVVLSQNGEAQLGQGPDPLFSSRTHISPPALSLAGRQERPVKITVDVPKSIRSDDYFLGFLVSPVITSSAVKAVNSVGALVVLNVPGARQPALTARYMDLPRFVFAGSVRGFIRAKSSGLTTVQFTTQTEMSGFVTPRPTYLTEQSHLLPPGLTWDVPVHFSSWLGLGWYTVRSTLVYNATPQRTAEVALSRTVVLVNPWWVVALIVLIAVIVFYLVFRSWRRRRRRRRSAPA
jgi:hypothetical protein